MITVTKDDGSTYPIHYLEHMVHHTNLDNVLTNGLLSHNLAHQRGFIQQDISMSEVQDRRARKNIDINGTVYPLHDFVCFYFNSRNPMLYKRRNIQHELVVLCVTPEIIIRPLTIFSDGNAANNPTQFYMGVANLKHVPFELTTSGSWNNENEIIKKENVRKMCSEVLAHNSVEVAAIKKIICPNSNIQQYAENVKRRLGNVTSHIEIGVSTGYFFM